MTEEITYAKSGVDIDVTDTLKGEMADAIDSSDPRVLNRMGAFGSLVDGRFEKYRHPVLVLKTEEPGSNPPLPLHDV